MEHLNVKIVDKNFDIKCREKNLVRLCKNYLTDEKPDFYIEITEEDVKRETEKSDELKSFSYGYLETLAAYRKICDILASYGSILVHGASICVDHKTFLFTAKSGVGKTTHIKMWLENVPGAYVVNGDKPIVTIKDGNVLISGTPWAGKESLENNVTEPLTAVVFVHRADENKIVPVKKSEAFIKLFGQVHKPKDPVKMSEVVKTIEIITNNLVFYDLYCNMEPEAVIVSSKELLKL